MGTHEPKKEKEGVLMEEWILPKDLKFKAYMDGDALCIVPEDFINLQESPAFFIKLHRIKREEFRKFVAAVIEYEERDV